MPAAQLSRREADVRSLQGRQIVLGVTGGIAAYKSVEVCRRIEDAGGQVTPLLTAAALRFVGEATFSALATEKARTSLFEDEDPIPHITLGRQADLFLICPATARFIGAYASGIADDLLGASLLATRAPVVVCPAMHTEMWEHPAVVDNLSLLRRRGVIVVWPEQGRLAGGDFGAGRLASSDTILAAADDALRAAGADALSPALNGAPRAAGGGSMAKLKVLVTAGGTREPLDPVRFLGNRSSGKQGYALAEAAWCRGAEVSLVAASQRSVPPGVELTLVETAEEMRREVLVRRSADVVMMAAAVSDYRPSMVAAEKIKKADWPESMTFEPSTDILAELGRTREQGQTLVGFAAETTDVIQNSEDKLRSKGVDLLVVNDVSAPGVGFGHDTNAVLMIDRHGERTSVPLTSKTMVAEAVLDRILALRANPGEELTSSPSEASSSLSDESCPPEDVPSAPQEHVKTEAT